MTLCCAGALRSSRFFASYSCWSRTPSSKSALVAREPGARYQPPPPAAIRLYLTFLVDLRANKGAVETASQALSFLALSNSWPTGLMDGAARIPVDAARRMFRAQT